MDRLLLRDRRPPTHLNARCRRQGTGYRDSLLGATANRGQREGRLEGVVIQLVSLELIRTVATQDVAKHSHEARLPDAIAAVALVRRLGSVSDENVETRLERERLESGVSRPEGTNEHSPSSDDRTESTR